MFDNRSAWNRSPRPARVKYGIALSWAQMQHMRELTRLRGARFEIFAAAGRGRSAVIQATRRYQRPALSGCVA